MTSPEILAGCLDRLSNALISLDQAAVERSLEELEDLRPQMASAWLAGADVALLTFQLHHAARLAEGATTLYSGWTRLTAPPASAYAPSGSAPLPAPPGSVAVEA